MHGKHFEIGGKQMKFFSVDSPLYRFLSRVLDILKLNMDSWKPAGFYDRGIDHGGNVSCVKVSG